MSRSRIRYNDRAIETAMKDRLVAAPVEKLAEEIADNVRRQGIRVEGIPGDIDLPVKVDAYDTDRARASVILAHPSGLAVQAKHGALTKAASAAGARVVG